MYNNINNLKEGERMKKIFTSLILSIVLLSSCSKETSLNEELNMRKESTLNLREDIPSDFIPKSYKIVSIGDSLTFGVGDSTERGGYIPYLQEQLEAEKGIKEAVFSNYGVRGNRTVELLGQLHRKEVREAIKGSDMVIITTGGNDVMKVVKENLSGLMLEDFAKEKEQYEKNFRSIISTIREINEDTIICVIGLYNPFYEYFSDIKEMDMILEEWNDISRKVLQEYEYAYFVNISDIFQESEEDLLYTDYFHPNDIGYQLIAEQVYTVLNEQALEVLGNPNYASGHEE